MEEPLHRYFKEQVHNYRGPVGCLYLFIVSFVSLAAVSNDVWNRGASLKIKEKEVTTCRKHIAFFRTDSLAYAVLTRHSTAFAFRRLSF